MTIELTIQIPDALGQRLMHFRDRLPEILERGLQEIISGELDELGEEGAIVDILVTNPRPDEILAIQPSSELQTRASALLARSKQGELSRKEEAELERYLALEHLVRLAKASAAKQMAG